MCADSKHHAAPKTALDIGIIARKRVRCAFAVLGEVMRDKTAPAASRVAAAKAVVEFGKIDVNDLKRLDDVQLHAVAARIIAAQKGGLAVVVKTAQDNAAGPLPQSKHSEKKDD